MAKNANLDPVFRMEQYLGKIAYGAGEIPPYPIFRKEFYLDYIAKHGLDSFFDAYNPEDTYMTGDIVQYEGKIYKALTDIDTPEEFTPEHWQQIKIPDITGSGGIQPLILTAEANTTVDGLVVPDLSETDILAAYNAFVAGRPTIIVDATEVMNLAVVNCDTDSSNYFITLVYYDVALLNYSDDGTITVKKFEGGEAARELNTVASGSFGDTEDLTLYDQISIVDDTVEGQPTLLRLPAAAITKNDKIEKIATVLAVNNASASNQIKIGWGATDIFDVDIADYEHNMYVTHDSGDDFIYTIPAGKKWEISILVYKMRSGSGYKYVANCIAKEL